MTVLRSSGWWLSRMECDLDMENTKNILLIPDDTQYWLVRANTKAEFYDDFQYNNFIAIGDNYVGLQELLDIPEIFKLTSESHESQYKGIFTKKSIDRYRSNNPDATNLERQDAIAAIKRSCSIAASKTFKFIEQIKIGDVILVPNEGSSKFLLGIITSSVFDDDIHHVKLADVLDDLDDYGYHVSNFQKKRRVFWIKEFSRSDLPDKIAWIVSTRQTVYNLTDYADSINPLISSTYVYKGNCYARIGVTTKKEISTADFFALQQAINEVTKQSNENVFQQINVQSPGYIILHSILDNWELISMLVLVLAGNIKEGKVYLNGIIPYFLERTHRKAIQKIEEDFKKEELRSKKLDNDSKELSLKLEQLKYSRLLESKSEISEASKNTSLDSLGLTSSDVGDAIVPESQMDNLTPPTEESSKKSE